MDAAIAQWRGESGAAVVIAGNSLGGTAALRAAERHDGGSLAGIVPIAPAGLDMPSWFPAIQGAPLVRAMLRSPVPVPEAAVRRAVGSTYRVLAFASPRKADEAVVDAFTTHFGSQRDVARLLATGKRLLPEIRSPFELRPRALPRAGGLGRARPDGGVERGRTRSSRRLPETHGRAAAALRALPPDRGAGPAGGAARELPLRPTRTAARGAVSSR